MEEKDIEHARNMSLHFRSKNAVDMIEKRLENYTPVAADAAPKEWWELVIKYARSWVVIDTTLAPTGDVNPVVFFGDTEEACSIWIAEEGDNEKSHQGFYHIEAPESA